MQLMVRGLAQPALEQRDFEICEHKGVGHPDTVADALCEAVAQALCHEYLASFGRVRHFNVDKGLLAGGQSYPRFSGGEVLAPMKMILCGRATPLPAGRSVEETVLAAARGHWREHLRADVANVEFRSEVRPGSAALRSVVERTGVPRSNDTSFGAGFAPYSPLEAQVLRLADLLASVAFRNDFPAAGDDFKIMGLRQGAQCRFTVAVAMIDRHVPHVRGYFEIKRAIERELVCACDPGALLTVNALDDPGAADEGGLYLTVTGMSAEMGDDGQVGRGNRVSRLITPGRAMSLEATAGKNPSSHVGKIYNALAQRIAQVLCREVDEVTSAQVQILSTIGAPLAEPQALVIELGTRGPLTSAVAQEARRAVREQLGRIAALQHDLVSGRVTLF
jgi:S-adenosylmethionine synthetase